LNSWISNDYVACTAFQALKPLPEQREKNTEGSIWTLDLLLFALHRLYFLHVTLAFSATQS